MCKIETNLYLNVLPETTLEELEDLFSELFPFLQMELYRKSHLLSNHKRQRELQLVAMKKEPKVFVIQPEMSVSEMETAFWDNLGLKVLVFRKVGSSLIETNFTMSWTLKRQNDKAEELISFLK